MVLFCIAGLSLVAAPVSAGEAEKAPPSGDAIKLPGIKIDVENRHVDVDAQVCLTDGLLELVACTKGTKEHESVVVVEAKAIHIHTALLLIGARNGNPAMRKPINEEQTRWMHLPPRGDSIKVFLVVPDEEGNPVERPISDFIRRTQGDPYGQDFGYETPETSGAAEQEKFPDVFLFAGSHLIDDGQGGKQYLVEQSGNLISISTFGDELLCLPGFQSQANPELSWEINPTHLPNLDSKVILRLRPVPDE